MDQPSFYAIIPATVRYDNNVMPNAKLLYGEISAMCGKEGYCWAENNYFAELYKVSTSTISRWISQLERCNHIKTQLNKKEGNSRKIFLSDAATNLLTKSARPIDEKRKRVVTKSARPIDEKRKSIYESITINNTMNREEFAFAFFETNYPTLYELFCMKYKSSIKDFEEFKTLFDAKFEKEKLELDPRVINGRLTSFAINYIRNEKESAKVIQMKHHEPMQEAYRKTIM